MGLGDMIEFEKKRIKMEKLKEQQRDEIGQEWCKCSMEYDTSNFIAIPLSDSTDKLVLCRAFCVSGQDEYEYIPYKRTDLTEIHP